MATRKEDFVSDAQNAARALWDALGRLESLQHEATALNYATTLGTQGGLDSADVIAVVFTTANALRGLLNSGHATNMAKLL
jgi:hypothetical protein